MKINYSIKEILDKWNSGVRTEEIQDLYFVILNYKEHMEEKVSSCLQALERVNPENRMKWVQDNASSDIKQYVLCAVLGKTYNVLMRSERRWKTVSDIGIEIEEPHILKNHLYFDVWTKQADRLSDLGCPIFESHAHYNLKNYNGVRETLLKLMHNSGITHIIIPAVDESTNEQMLELFDKPEFPYVYFAFGNHPKYLWKRLWAEENWQEYRKILFNKKCVGVGETGLDYSYPGFCEEHRQKQMEMLEKFIDIANEYSLPMILHIRSGESKEKCRFEANEDALDILARKRIQNGAVLHCFGGTYSDVLKYMAAGVTSFGIGGRITYEDCQLEEAVRKMPDSALLLETDAPYMKLNVGSCKKMLKDAECCAETTMDAEMKCRSEIAMGAEMKCCAKIPNSSLSLLNIAYKVAEIRGTTIEKILHLTYENSLKLFPKCK